MRDDIAQHLFDTLKMTCSFIDKGKIATKFSTKRSEVTETIFYLKSAGYIDFCQRVTNGNACMLTASGYHMRNGGWIAYLERLKNQDNILNDNAQNEIPKKKKPKFSIDRLASWVTVAGFIVGCILIDENTPYLGGIWWREVFLGIWDKL